MNDHDASRLHSAVLVSPKRERRRDRKARKIAARDLLARDRAEQKTVARAKADALTAERKATVLLPKAGEPGSDGVFVGQDLYSGSSFVYDPWVLYARGLITAPNVVLAGIVGSGKSSLAKSLYTRSIPFGRRVYIPGDPKGEHTGVAEAVGGKAIALGHGMSARLNPLDEGHRPSGLDDTQWAAQVSARRRDLLGALAETVLDRRLSPLEHTAIDIALAEVVRTAEVPVLPLVVDRLLEPDPTVDPTGRLTEAIAQEFAERWGLRFRRRPSQLGANPADLLDPASRSGCDHPDDRPRDRWPPVHR